MREERYILADEDDKAEVRVFGEFLDEGVSDVTVQVVLDEVAENAVDTSLLGRVDGVTHDGQDATEEFQPVGLVLLSALEVERELE